MSGVALPYETPGAPGIRLRPETPDDDAFLREVYAGSRELEIAMVPWDDAQKQAFLNQQFDAQRTHYRREYPNASYDVLLNEETPVGRLYVDRGDEYWLVLDIALLPVFRNAGIGSAVMRSILAQAAAARKEVHVHVDVIGRARPFYERLGFTLVSQAGMHMLMVWSPPP